MKSSSLEETLGCPTLSPPGQPGHDRPAAEAAVDGPGGRHLPPQVKKPGKGGREAEGGQEGRRP